ncbi:hypothetical protein [Micromonospora echinofusca]|uniref:Bacterial transcriptional activator domain-containing protein n=1 Tax=Micromonospora echinofusca TaxID=47858 RepID=A0ABS3W0R6_MICEH|nr:hypothetical protein [Micromonospora echinofusca]MBO4210390.1 hypothetical protein [Micromonospora echinofusca]
MQEAGTLLQAAIRVDPYNKDLHRRAVHALTGLGDQAAIDTLLDTYTRRLTTAGLKPHHDPHQPTAYSDS